MDTPDEIARDVWMSELLDEVSQQAVDQFAFNRLRSYYLNNREVAVKAISTLKEAKKVSELSPTAAAVLFTTAVELGLKIVLLKPVVFGLVHNESVAELVSDLSVRQNGFDRFKPLLTSILSEYAGIDFSVFRINGHASTIWEEIVRLQNMRNAILHRGDSATLRDTELAEQIAETILGSFFPSLLDNLGLKYLQGGKIIGA